MQFVESADANPEGLKNFCNPATIKDDYFGENMKSYADDLIILYDASDKWMCSR